MTKKRITNSNEQLTTNFKISEFWNVKYGGHVDFDIPQCLIDAAQIIRDFYGSTLITSTIRLKDKFGYHKSGNAIDLLPLKNTLANIKNFGDECIKYQKTKDSDLIIKLRKAGVEGFGIEGNNCVHLDFRNGKNCASRDRYGSYIVFEWHTDGTPTGKSTVIY